LDEIEGPEFKRSLESHFANVLAASKGRERRGGGIAGVLVKEAVMKGKAIPSQDN